MFAVKPWAKISTRALLIAVILFNALAPNMTTASALSPGHSNKDPLNPDSLSADSGKTAGQPSTAPVGSTKTNDIDRVDVPNTNAPASAAPTPALLLTADPDYLTANSQLILSWTIEGVSIQSYQLLQLQITLPDGLSLQPGYPGTYDPATRVLTITVTALSGQVGLATGATVNDTKFKAELMGDSRKLAENKLDLPIHEEFVVDQQGGEITAQGGKIKIKIPADTFRTEAVIDVGEPGSQAMPTYSLMGQSFEINAKDKKDKTKLHQFTKKIEIEVDYAELNIPEEKIQNLFLYWYNPETRDWGALPSSANPTTKTLKGKTDHFSVFAVGLNEWQAARMPSVDDFQVSGFTGAATFSLPIEIPAGPGGFQPSLTLSYNSQALDQSTMETQASWVGMGWTLETGSIEVDRRDSPGSLDDIYFVNVGGISSRLIHDGQGHYYSADENFWKFDLNGTTNQWTVQDKVGNTYFFEQMVNLYYGLPCQDNGTQQGGKESQIYKWVLTRVRNIYGKELSYEYEKETKNLTYEEYSTGAGHCNTYTQSTDTAIFPTSITYPNGRYRIFFERESRLDYPSAWAGDNAHHSFERSRLKNIHIQYAPNGTSFVDPRSNSSQTLRRYRFTYGSDPSQVIFPNYLYTAGGNVSTLIQVQEFGVGGITSLPAHTFTYADGLHLTQAANGYGGSVVFDYDSNPNATLLEPWHYDPATTKSYTYLQTFSGSQDHCPTRSWSARNASSACQISSNNALSVTGTAIRSGFGPTLTRPGGVYRLTTNRGTSVATAWIGAYDGRAVPEADHLSNPYTAPGPMSLTFTLPASASTMQPLLQTSGGSGGPYTDFSSVKVELLPSFYRVHQKRVSDGQGNTYTYSYSYSNDSGGETAAMNDKDNTHSDVCGPSDPADCTSLVEAYTEFRGNGQVTETGPDGRKTITTFAQDDVYKGQPNTIVVKDAAGTNLTKTEYFRGYVTLPIWNYGNYDYLGLVHSFVHPALTENRVYLAGGQNYSTTWTEYTYDESASTNYSYGNLITQKDQFWNGSARTTYRTTTTDYFPNTSPYLVGFPARQQIKDASNTVIAESLNIYDGNSAYNAAPTVGKLAAVRSWMDGALSSSGYSQVTFVYDSWGNPTTVTTYSGYGSPTATPSGGARTAYTCYGDGGTLGGTACSNDGIQTFPLWSKNPLNQTATWTYDYKLGVPLTETDPNGNPTSAQYDIFGRMTKLIRPGNGDSTTSPTLAMDYHDGVSFWTEIRQRIDGTRHQAIRRHYDGIGRQTYIENGSKVGSTFTVDNKVTYSYPAFNIVRQSMPYAPGGAILYTETVSDVLGRPLTITPPNGNGTSYSYNGLVSTVTDPKGNGTTTTTDFWGRVISVAPPTGPNVTYTYDELDHLKTATRGGVTTTLTYDAGGRKRSMADPDMGSWTYAYDALGNLTRQNDARGQRICLYYDVLNRMTGKHYRTDDNCPASPTPNVSYLYDQGTNGIGQRTSMTDSSGSSSWSYDVRGRMTQEGKTINGATGSFNTSWTYNSADLPVSMVYPDNETLTYTYNNNGQLYSISSNIVDPSTGAGQVYLASTDYDEAGRITTFDFGTIHKTFNYYPWNTNINGGLLNTAITTRVSDNASLQNLAYAYDKNANVQTITDVQAGSQLQTFGYDALDRLTSAAVTGGTNGLYNETYQYNATTGNLSTKAGVAYTYDPAHPHAVQSLSNGSSYAYDANGNMTSRHVGALTFDLVYDAENRLISVTGNGTPPTATPSPTSTNTPSGPTATFTPTPTNTNTPSGPTPTPTNTSQPSNNAVYLSLSGGDTLGGLAVDDLDILYFDGANWSMFFDASDVGITEGGADQDLNDFQIVDSDTILLTFDNALTIGTLSVDPNDIVQFDATSLGATTAGTFSMYLDGSDVGLDDTTNEVIDALDVLPDGRVLISTIGPFTIPGLTGNDEDLLVFTPTTLGDTTSGTWAMYFDGSLTALGLGQTAEDIDALEIAANGNIYLSTADVFSVTGISGDDEDIFVCTPTYTSGAVTSCSYSSTLYFDGSVYGLSANDVDALNLPLSLALSPSTGSGQASRAQSKRTHDHFASYMYSPPQQSGSVTFNPVADAYVAGDATTTNYGTATTLRADNSPDLNSYLRFDVQGLTGGVTSATLRIYANSASSTGYDLYRVSDNTWTETGINYGNAPAMGTQIGSSGTFSAGVWTSIDVTSYVTGNGVYSLAFSTTSNTNISFASRESGANAPQLVIETASSPTNTPTATPTPTASATPTPVATNTPTPTNTPIPPSGDKDTTGVFRPGNGGWYLKNTNTAGFAEIAFNFGQSGDAPVAGDWDGDGDSTVGVYRNGVFYLLNTTTTTTGFADLVFAFGEAGDKPLAGDWDGDGVDTIGTYNSSTGVFLLGMSNNAGAATLNFAMGISGDLPVVGDWNGDGTDTIGVFRPGEGKFYLKNDNDQGFADIVFAYGVPGDQPVTGDWNNDGIDTAGVYRNNTFYLRNANTTGIADLAFGLGNPGDLPVAGDWDGLPSSIPPTSTPAPTSTPTRTPTAGPTPTNPPTPTPTPAGVFSSASFTYDGDGKRVKSAITTNLGTTTTYFVGAHYEVTGSTITKYYYAGAQRIAMRSNGTVFFTLGDHLGSTSLTTFANGSLVSELRYKAWGEVRYASGNMPTKYQFTGQFSYETDFGLYFYNARWYDSALGRFTQADPVIPDPYNSQSYDRFAYVFNNPISYTDPGGHCAVDSNGHIKQKGGKIAKTDCAVEDFYKLNWNQRLEWMKLFVGEHNLGNWFDDIISAIEVMMNDPELSDPTGATYYMDAAVLQEINNGWNMAQGRAAVGGQQAEAGASGWENFFRKLAACQKSNCNQDTLIDERLQGEDDGVNVYAWPLTNQDGYYSSDDEMAQLDLSIFLDVANKYRDQGITWSQQGIYVIDPRTVGPYLKFGGSVLMPVFTYYTYSRMHGYDPR